MPDTMLAEPRVEEGLSLAQRIGILRLPLPSHDLIGGNFRKRAVAIIAAEVKHREADFARVERLLGIAIDRWDQPNCAIMGQYPHEARAGEASLWLSALQAHESEKRTPFNFKAWRDWHPSWRRAWIAKRRSLWRGFLRAVHAYQDARKEAGL